MKIKITIILLSLVLGGFLYKTNKELKRFEGMACYSDMATSSCPFGCRGDAIIYPIEDLITTTTPDIIWGECPELKKN